MWVDALALGVLGHCARVGGSGRAGGDRLVHVGLIGRREQGVARGRVAGAVDAKSTPPSISPAKWPDPPKLNVTLLPPLAVWTKSWVRKSNAGSVFDAARKVVPEGCAEAEPPPAPTAPGKTARTSHDAPTRPGSDSFLDNVVSPFGGGETRSHKASAPLSFRYRPPSWSKTPLL